MRDIRLDSRLPRHNWKERVEEAGLTWHGADGLPYWTEDRNLVLTLQAAETLEAAANEMHAMCLHACSEIVTRGWLDRLSLPEDAARLAEASWRMDDPYLYGRFDFAWDGNGQPKLLEYNADTPTSLLEAAVVQWQWLEDVAPESDQLNSIHEALIDRWKLERAELIHFACVWENEEDRQTIAYLAETAEQAGKQVELLDMGEIGLSPEGRFTDTRERPIEKIFKLYPWEWMAKEDFFGEVELERDRFLEPAWKMMLSNKALLAILWELNPGHDLLLPAFLDERGLRTSGVTRWVEKPLFGREGAGVNILHHGRTVTSGIPHQGQEPRIYQQQTELFKAGGLHFVWGLWMIGDECRGLSARGDTSAVTGNLSRFVPHRIEG
jgi:glutathionylspermidine synthase